MGRPVLGVSARSAHVQAKVTPALKAQLTLARGGLSESEWIYRVLRAALAQDEVRRR